MTKVCIRDNGGELFFEADCHADDHDVCTMVSAYTNVLVAIIRAQKFEPQEYKSGYVRIYIPCAADWLRGVFMAVSELFKATAEAYPDYLRMV